MRREPIEFGSMSVRRAKRPAAGFHHPHKSADPISAAPALDEAFANYASATSKESTPKNWQSATRNLIADIATQLETLDTQRRQLSRLLESVEAHPAS
jgi:hypothetical protein